MNKILLSIVFLVTVVTVNSQHYIGLKDAFGIMNISSDPSMKSQKIETFLNPGIVYRYEHKKYFAFQTEINYISKGYIVNNSTHNIYSYELPILSQAFVRFGWFRPYLTGGAFIGYISKIEIEEKGKKSKYKFNDFDNRFEYGIIGGAGIGITISRFEIQTEWRYQYAFSFLRHPHINGVTQYMNATQMMISLSLFYRLTK